jgi:hypothetical protein
MMNWTAVSRDKVSAIPASSMITNVDRPMPCTQSGSLPWRMDQVSLASVSAGAPAASRSCAAAAADGASPTTWPPLSRHARARVRIAVVFPAPTGAIASCSRAPEVHMERTRAACPTSKVFPLAAASSSASSTVAASATRPSVWPAVATRRCSAARIRVEVNNSDPATV